MFSVGDKIVYPMHGAGVIESIEEREILGEKHNYYVVKMPVGDLKVMIPTHNCNDIGIREIISIKDVDRVFDILKDQSINVTSNWNKRYRENMVKIKSGDIYEVADVVRTLMLREKRVMEAMRIGFKSCIVPAGNMKTIKQAKGLTGIDIKFAGNVQEALDLLF